MKMSILKYASVGGGVFDFGDVYDEKITLFSMAVSLGGIV